MGGNKVYKKGLSDTFSDMNLKYVCMSVLESESKKRQETPGYGKTCLQLLLPPGGRKIVARAEGCICILTSMYYWSAFIHL